MMRTETARRETGQSARGEGSAAAPGGPWWQGRLAQALAGLEYGEVRLSVQGGRVVQVDRTERFREGE